MKLIDLFPEARCLVLAASLCLVAATTGAADEGKSAQDLFVAANEAYAAEDFAQAATLYERSLEKAESAASHYNLANTYARLGETGKSVLHYEKALALNPGDADAEANLAQLRSEVELAAPEPSWLVDLATAMQVDVWSYLLAGAFWLGLASMLAARLFGVSPPALYTLGGFCFVACLVSVVALSGYHQLSQRVVAQKDETPLRIARRDDSPPNARMRAGEIGVIEKKAEDYYLVRNAAGEVGWAKSGEIGLIWD